MSLDVRGEWAAAILYNSQAVSTTTTQTSSVVACQGSRVSLLVRNTLDKTATVALWTNDDNTTSNPIRVGSDITLTAGTSSFVVTSGDMTQLAGPFMYLLAGVTATAASTTGSFSIIVSKSGT